MTSVHFLIFFEVLHYTPTNVSIFVFALGAAAHVANSLDVLFLEASLVVENGDAVGLHHKGQSRRRPVCWVIVVVSILKIGKKKIV